MNSHIKLLSVLVFTLMVSCTTSMTPTEVYNTLPTLTNSNFIPQSQAEETIASRNCSYLVKGRTYTAPIGFTTKNDLQNAANGIDEWVQLDGGNAYVLTNYKWVTVADDGSTQLHVDFDTLKCN